MKIILIFASITKKYKNKINNMVELLKIKNEEIFELSNYDPLTGLANLRLATDSLEKSLTRAQRYNENVAILFMDLDSFKDVNDIHGHNR